MDGRGDNRDRDGEEDGEVCWEAGFKLECYIILPQLEGEDLAEDSARRTQQRLESHSDVCGPS